MHSSAYTKALTTKAHGLAKTVHYTMDKTGNHATITAPHSSTGLLNNMEHAVKIEHAE